MKKKKSLLLLLLCFLCSLETFGESSSAQFEAIKHVVRTEAYWQKRAKLSRPLLERIEPAPAELIDYLKRDNAQRGYSEIPQGNSGNTSFRSDLAAAVNEIPGEASELISNRLVGIFLVENLGGSAYTDTVIDASGHEVAAFTVLDTGSLNKLANDWASWRENSPFLPTSGWKIVSHIEDDPGNNRKNALEFILLHEFGHVASIGRKLHPSWNQIPPDDPKNYSFSALSWTIFSGSCQSFFDSTFPLRAQIAFYKGDDTKIPIQNALSIYNDLEKTNFVSLYGSTSPADDFAESFAVYVHTQIMKRPYSVDILHQSDRIREFKSCWGESRCETKRKLLETLLRSHR